jgi:hypothetical protein
LGVTEAAREREWEAGDAARRPVCLETVGMKRNGDTERKIAITAYSFSMTA